jgi:hypothetical protein
MDLYGKTKADKLAEENEVARKILAEMNNFGISERQRYLIMYYLSLELEDVENSRAISELLKDVYPDISMTHIYERNS